MGLFKIFQSLEFQSTPPVWAETSQLSGDNPPSRISIHSARVGGDYVVIYGRIQYNHFNPLRPCGRRPGAGQCFCRRSGFQSTPPVWAETRNSLAVLQNPVISIHSARVGGDEKTVRQKPCRAYFNPLRPCGRRPQKKPVFLSLKHLHYNIFYRKKQENPI